LVMASARISCSDRSEKFFNATSFQARAGFKFYIRRIPNWKGHRAL
jgi:hypothetical protein